MLTIYIPTFNRVERLKYVLLRLINEIDSQCLNHLVKIKVFNNCSTDETKIFINAIARPYLFVHHRGENIGARANVYDAVNHCDTEFLWILGDDDLPMPGLLTLVAKFIKERKPSLLYLPAIWNADMLTNSLNNASHDLKFREFNSGDFIKLIGVKITFISSFILNFENYKSITSFEKQTCLFDTDFGHLSFYAPLILRDNSLFAIDDVVISATGNSNFKYSLIKSFSVDLPFVFKTLFSVKPFLFKALIRNLIVSYLPSIIYSVKYNKVKSLDNVIPWSEIQDALGGHFIFWIYVFPIKYFPRFLCLPLIVVGRFFR